MPNQELEASHRQVRAHGPIRAHPASLHVGTGDAPRHHHVLGGHHACHAHLGGSADRRFAEPTHGILGQEVAHGTKLLDRAVQLHAVDRPLARASVDRARRRRRGRGSQASA
eukprot:scaffold261_cov336-Pavlova_lutheri.AAC.42